MYMKKTFKLVTLIGIVVLALGLVPAAMAQDSIESVCLVTDLGRVNDGTFNETAYNGMVAVADEYDLDSTFIETQAETDYEANIQTCVDEGFEVIITVGFLIADATRAAAEANPDVYFVGVDQFVTEGPENYVGIQFREDQAGFMAGVLAAFAAESIEADTVAGVYGVDIPPVKKFRNGFENGVKYVNAELNILGVYIDNFVAPDRGASAAEQFIGEGAAVIFGAGGPTGSGGIAAAAAQDIFVIGVDQDEFFTTFGAGETPGAEYIISSAIKRVDQGVFDMVAALAEGDMDSFPGGEIYLMTAELNGVGLAPANDSILDEAVYAMTDEVYELLISGEIGTGVDPVSGDLLEEEMMMDGELVTIAEMVIEAASAEEDAQFTTLLAAVLAADEAVVTLLSDPEAEVTVFAPTDEAFAALVEALGEDAFNAILEDPATLTNILLYHVVEGAVDSATVVGLEDGTEVATLLADASLTVSFGEGGEVFVNDSQVVIVDVMASNGIIHVIDAVLVPAAGE
jgi:basic membrane protein A